MTSAEKLSEISSEISRDTSGLMAGSAKSSVTGYLALVDSASAVEGNMPRESALYDRLSDDVAVDSLGHSEAGNTAGNTTETVANVSVSGDDSLVENPANPEFGSESGQLPADEAISSTMSHETAMQDYYRLQQNLLGLTVAFGAIIFPFVWGFYSLQIALDYMLGACAGVVYLRMLGRNVSEIGRENNGRRQKHSSSGRLAIFAGVMIVALRWDQLEVVPVFLGFLTYKAAIIAFVLWTSVRPRPEAT